MRNWFKKKEIDVFTPNYRVVNKIVKLKKQVIDVTIRLKNNEARVFRLHSEDAHYRKTGYCLATGTQMEELTVRMLQSKKYDSASDGNEPYIFSPEPPRLVPGSVVCFQTNDKFEVQIASNDIFEIISSPAREINEFYDFNMKVLEKIV